MLLPLVGILSRAWASRNPPASRKQKSLCCDRVERPWVSLPADVMLLVAAHLEQADVGRIRLVCSSWRAGLDGVLECLELTAFPETVGWMDKFPVLKSLKIVKPGSHPCSPNSGTTSALPPLSDAARASCSSPDSTYDTIPESMTAPEAAPSNVGTSSPRADRAIELPDAANGEPRSSDASPGDKSLSTLLKTLHRRHVKVKHLAVFYAGPKSVAYLPPGLRSLTIVNLESDGAAALQLAGQGTAGVAGMMAVPAFAVLDFPDAAWANLRQLLAIKMVNCLPNMSALASCTELTKLVLQGEEPSTLKSTRRRSKAGVCQLGPDLGRLLSLREIEVRWVRLLELPPQLSSLSNLTSLNLSDCLLRALPNEVGHLRQLQRLSASGNPELRLPQSLGQLQGLRFLNLSWTRCDTQELFDLVGSFQVLEELRLTGNNIRHLPSSIKTLKSLKVLVLSVNQLESLPVEISMLSTLEHLDCSLNHMTHLDRLPPALARLNLQTNGLKSLPDDMGLQLGNTLQWLDISNNSITLLPGSIAMLSRLQTLRISFNQLQEINCAILSKMKLLKLVEAYYAGSPAMQRKLPTLQKSRPNLIVAC